MSHNEWFEQQKSENCLMNNDWIAQIANEGNSRREQQRTEEKERQEHRKRFEACADDLWTRLQELVQDSTDHYNSLVEDDDRVFIQDPCQNHEACTLTLHRMKPHNVKLFICLNKSTEQLVCGHRRFAVRLSEDGVQLWDRGHVSEVDWVQEILQEFFRV